MDKEIVEQKALYEAYFQRSADYYIERMVSFPTRKIYFNPFAFFMGLFWLLYRKLYIEFFAVLLALIVVGYTEDYLFRHTYLYNYQQVISWTISILFLIAYGCFANYFYFKKAKRYVDFVNTNFAEEDVKMAYLKKKGGTSMLSVILFIVGMILLTAIYNATH